MSDLVALRPGTILAEDYRIERTLGAGGFGITYLAEEIPLARLVTIKEYFPVDFAARDPREDVVPRSRDSEGDYSWGLDRFLAEAQTLAKFTHPNIVRVYRYFLARNTGYIVLHYEEGASLKGWLKSLGRAPRQPELDRILEPLLGALETVHAADYLHRDIAPDNIMIRRDGSPVLIDFGSARGDIAKHSKTISALVKSGYSPYEQYATTSRQQGPWTDIYSLGATLYEAVTGRRPPDSPTRMVADEMIPPADAALSSYRPQFLAAIAKSLKNEISERPKSIAEWRAELLAPPAPRRAAPTPKPQSQSQAARASSAASAASGDSDAPVMADALVGAEAAPAVRQPAKPAPVAEKPDAAARRGLAAAFLDGWRQASSAQPGVEAAQHVEQAEATPPKTPASPPTPAKKPTRAKPAVAPNATPRAQPQRHPGAVAEPKADTPAPGAASPRRLLPFGLGRRRTNPTPPPEPGARRATPRALRKQSTVSWRGLAAKCAVALGVTGAVVAIQDQIPSVHREGAGLLTSQINADVPLVQLKGHDGIVSAVAFTDDGQRIVSAAADGKLKVWDAARGILIRTIELDSGPASAFALTRGRAATGHKDGTTAIWSLETGSKLVTFRRNEASIWSVAFTGGPDGVATAAHDWSVAVWDAATPMSPEHVLEGHSNAAKVVAFASRGPFLASGSADATVKLWSLDRGSLIRTYRGHGDFVSALAFEPKGRTLASASVDGQIRLWSTYSNRQKRRLKAHEGPVRALVFAPDGDHLVSAGGDGTVRIWSTSRGRLLRTLQGGNGTTGLAALAMSPDGRRIAVAGADNTVRLFDVSIPKEGT